ncbi:MAG: hypothetical protein ACO3NK_00270 [Prochlorotrichaceae cyanobacterium]
MADHSPDSFDASSLDPETIAAHYRLLELRPGATIEAVDQAYFRLKRQTPRTAKADLEALKIAHHTVKGMLQHYFPTETEPPALDTTETGTRGTTRTSTATTAFPLTESPPDRQDRSNPLLAQLLTQWLNQKGISAEVSLSQGALHIQVSAPQYPNPSSVLGKIKATLQKLTDRERQDLKEIKVYGMQRRQHILWSRQLTIPASQTTPSALSGLGLNPVWSDLIWFPLISVLAMLCNYFPPTHFLLVGLRIWLHEWGHATIAWLSGYRAIPLPFGWTNVGETRSLWVYCSVLALISLFGWSSWREQRRWGLGIAIGLGLLQVWLTWGISEDTFGMLLAFSGIGGEFCLCAFLMMSFFFPLPQYFRWEVNRFPVVFSAAVTFWNAFFLWRKVSRGQAFIPWGTLLGGEGDGGGDMNILVAYGWSYDRIIDTYHPLSNFCLLVILGVYAYALIQAYRVNSLNH